MTVGIYINFFEKSSLIKINTIFNVLKGFLTKLSEKRSMEILAKFTGCEKRLAKEREERTGSTVPRLQNCLMRITKKTNKQTIRENP